jgi:hypothetical protein
MTDPESPAGTRVVAAHDVPQLTDDPFIGTGSRNSTIQRSRLDHSYVKTSQSPESCSIAELGVSTEANARNDEADHWCSVGSARRSASSSTVGRTRARDTWY